MRRILILSSTFGQGHMATARALQSAAQTHPELDLQIDIIDFSEEINRIFNTASKRIYDINAKHAPLLHKWLYTSTDRSHLPIRLMNIWNYPIRRRALRELIGQHQPDLIISNYPIWQYIGYSLVKQYFSDVEFATLITDSISVHSSWVLPDSDFYIVANEPTASSLHKLGVANNKIHALGYPVQASFNQPVSTSFYTHYHLDPKQPIITWSAAAIKASAVIKTVEAIHRHYAGQLILIAGRDESLYHQLKERADWQTEATQLLGWCQDMPDFIKASDLIITKAGGSTVMECVAATTPMIINKVIPGQEEGNAELVERHRLGIVAERAEDIAQAVETIFSQIDDYRSRLAKEARPDAAAAILKFIAGRL